jgi:PAS domain S-box-containing protein
MNTAEALWETNISGLFISSVDGKITRVNPAFLKIFGCKNQNEVLGKSLSDLFKKNSDFLELAGLLLEGKNISNYVFLGKDSSGRDITCALNAHLTEEPNGDSGITGSIQNITELKNAEQNLLDTEKSYQNMFEHSTEIIQSFDGSGRLFFCNRTWHNKLEYSTADLMHITLFDIIAPELHEHCKELLHEVYSGKSLHDVSVTFYSKSGKKILLQGTVVPYIQQGKVLATHGFFRDITDQVNAINLAQEKEKLVSTIFDSLPICLYVKNEEGKYILTNNYMNQTLQISATGMSDSSIFPSDIIALQNETDKKALSEANKLINYDLHIRNEVMDSYFLCGKKAIPLDQEKSKVFGYSIDISEIMKAKQQLEVNQQMLQFVMNNTKEALLLFQKNDRNVYSLVFKNNRADQFFNQIKPLESLEDFAAYLDLGSDHLETLYQGEKVFLEKDITINEGVFSFLLNVSPLASANNEATILLSMYDITENKNLLEEVEKKYRENLLLIGEVYHRVKNNLAIIDGIFELKKSQINDQNVRQIISDMQFRVKSIALVHQKIYDASDLSTIPFKEYVEDLCSYYKRMYSTGGKNQVFFDFSIEQNVSLDINRAIPLGLLLSELISNSIKYGGKNGTVSVRIALTVEDKNWTLSFEDNGPGLGDGSPKGDGAGGFGLKLIKSLEKQLKGSGSLAESGHYSYQLVFPSK